MYYIVFDLELNSKPFKNRHPNEIIEIGAVKLNQELETVSSFQAYVKPRIYKKLFPIVKRKTHIAQADINSADSFRSVLVRFRQWMEGDCILCSWGYDDIHHLKTNCEFNHLGSNWVKKFIDIQKQYSRIYGHPAGQRSSLKNALLVQEIPLTGKLHRADMDAAYTAAIFRDIFDKLEFDIC